MTRQICLDTETTGLEVHDGHRIIEIGCVEIVDRVISGKHFHVYINPLRLVDEGAFKVHGISNDFLQDKPLFADVAQDFLDFIEGGELIIHNAPFDVGFLNSELSKLKGHQSFKVEESCHVIDTLQMARQKHRGQKNNLDALCKRYHINNDARTLHGALLDSEILAEVYLAMTGGQISLFDSDNDGLDCKNTSDASNDIHSSLHDHEVTKPSSPLKVIPCSSDDNERHQALLNTIQQSSNACIWLQDE